MSDLWVVNASPVIVFAKIAQLDLLTRLPKDIVIPEAVAVGLRLEERTIRQVLKETVGEDW